MTPDTRSRACAVGAFARYMGAALMSWVSLVLLAHAAWAERAPAARPVLERSDVEPWLDGFMALSLRRSDIAGATVAVVKDGRVVLTKGYGQADVARGIPVVADRTLFRVASITKLFTWTAVMQQVERGRIDLDADINRYLDFKIPPYRGEPLTMRDLMTHTAGFELVMRDLFSARPNGVDLGATVKRWVPERLFAPGTTPTYSNYATALGGYIVQRVSGEPYDDYIDRHILGPLRMTRSSTRQPLPAPLQSGLSKGYMAGSGNAFPYEFSLHRPAGSLASTAPDIARFMLAHLDDGALDGARILRPETIQEMHSVAPATLPPLHGMALGFAQHDVNGRRVLSHDGDTRFFHSQLNLFIDEGVGIFVSFNSTGRDGAADVMRTGLFNAFANRYFPARATAAAPSILIDEATAKAHARAMTGYYEVSDRSASNFLAINRLRHQSLVTVDENGALVVPDLTGPDGAAKRWREIAPFVWREVGGHERLSAQLIDGRAMRFGDDEYSPLILYDRLPWWRSPAVLEPFGLTALAILLLAVLAIPVDAVIMQRRQVPLPSSARLTDGGIWLAAFSGLIVPQVWTEIITPVMNFTSDPDTIDTKIIFASALTLVSYGGGLLLTCLKLRAPSTNVWRSRIPALLLAASFSALLWLSWLFNLISFRTDF